MQKKIIFYDEISQFKNSTEDSQIIVLIPSTDVLLTSIPMPKLSRSRLMQAIPFALEDQLLQDVEDLHFAVGDHPINGAWPVAIIARKKMEEYLDSLKQSQINPDFILPSVLALPYFEQEWHGILENKIAWVRTGECAGFACDQANLAEVLKAAIAEASIKPNKIKIKKDTDEVFNIAQLETSQGYQEAALFSSPPINLLSSTKKSNGNGKRLFKISFYIAMVWVTLLLISPFVSYFILKNKKAVLDQEINNIYKNHFPGSVMVAPKHRMEMKLKKIKQNSNHNEVLKWLTLFGQSKRVFSGIQLQRFDFKNKRLTLEVTSDSSEDLMQLTHRLIRQGLQVKQENAVMFNSKIKALLQIRGQDESKIE